MSEPSRFSHTTISIVVVLLIVAATIIICDLTDWNLFIPLLLIGKGAHFMAVGIWKGARSKERVVRSEGSYTMFWGNLCVIIGIVILVNYWYPGNVLYIVIAFIIWLALALLLFGMKPKVPY